MNDKDLPILESNIDKSQVPSIHQKRLLAFINHFIVNTVTFLNDFIANCDSKFIECENKLQKVEASLLIVESKLASIQGVGDKSSGKAENSESTTPIDVEIEKNEKQDELIGGEDDGSDAHSVAEESSPKSALKDNVPSDDHETPAAVHGVKACEDERYKKYFKMLQVGVPLPAVRLKMEAEGYDSNVLNDPNQILPDGVPSAPPDEA